MRTGSLFNNLYGTSTSKAPEVGMGATRLMWTDRVACTVVDVSKSGKQVTVKRDKAVRTDNLGMTDSQTYSYSPDPDAEPITYSLRKDGTWVRKGDGSKEGERLVIGVRDEHYDFSF